MPELIPVDHNPFAAQIPPPGYTPEEIAASQTKPPQLVPVDHNPFGPQHPVAGSSGEFLTDAGRFAGTAAINAAAAGASTPRLIAQGVDWLGNKAGFDVGADRALSGIKHPLNQDYPLFPDFQTAREAMFSGPGLSTGATEYQPSTWLGRRGMDAATGGLVGALTGGVGAIPAAVGGSATAGASVERFPDHPLVAAMLGFIPGAAAANLAVNIPQRLGAAALSTSNSEPYAAFKRQGLPTELAGTTTGEPGLQYAEKLAARMPGSEGAVGAARGRLLTGWQDRLGQVADGLGSAATPQEAGVSLQAAARNWLNDFKTNTGNLWSDFYSKVPKDTPVSVTNYQDALTNVLGNFSGAPATGKILQPGTVKSLSDALGVDLQASGTLPWDAVKNIRTAIGEKLANPQTISDTSQAALKQLYAGLTRDMESGAGSVSQDALSSFHRANAATAAGHDLLETHLNPILNAATPEQATQYALAQARQGGSRIGAVTFNLPSAAGDLGSYALRNAATNTESPSALANALTGRKPIYSPEAQRVLFPNGGTQADIADLASAGRAMQPLERDLANSPTATHAARGPGRLIAAVELARQGHEIGGLPGALMGGAAGLFAPEMAGRAAQATALNPYLAALYGRNMPLHLTSPSPLARALIAPGLSQGSLPGARPLTLPAPATSANSAQQ